MALFSILLIKSVGSNTLCQSAAICILWWKDIPSCPSPCFLLPIPFPWVGEATGLTTSTSSSSLHCNMFTIVDSFVMRSCNCLACFLLHSGVEQAGFDYVPLPLHSCPVVCLRQAGHILLFQMISSWSAGLSPWNISHSEGDGFFHSLVFC